MKTGEEFIVTNEELLRPKVGDLFDVTLAGVKKPVRARLVEVSRVTSVLKVVPDNTID